MVDIYTLWRIGRAFVTGMTMIGRFRAGVMVETLGELTGAW
jgi:hypothetical protein